MNENDQAFYDDEIDLREIIKTLLQRWKTILLITLLVGLAAGGFSKLQQPVYEASVLISVNQATTLSNISMIDILLSDMVRQKTADKLGVNEVYSNIDVNNDENAYNITFQSNSAQEAAKIANTWAEVSLEVLAEKDDEILLLLTNEEEMKKAALDESDRIMFTYLQRQGLSSLTWVDLVNLTGIIDIPLTIILTDNKDLPTISLDQRLEITKLMWERNFAKNLYYETIDKANLAITNKPFILNYVVTPGDPVKPKTVRNVTLGIASGLMLGVFWVLTKEWWQNNDEQRDAK